MSSERASLGSDLKRLYIVRHADAGNTAEWIGPADDMILGFHTVFKHYYLQGLHQSTDVGELLA